MMRRRLTRRAGVALLVLGAIAVAAPLIAVAMRTGGDAARAADRSGVQMNATSMAGASYWGAVAGGAFRSTGVTRTYYIGADEVVWDYAPEGRNEITGEPFDEAADTLVRSGPGRIGSRTSSVSTAATPTRPFSGCRSAPPTSATSAYSGR